MLPYDPARSPRRTMKQVRRGPTVPLTTRRQRRLTRTATVPPTARPARPRPKRPPRHIPEHTTLAVAHIPGALPAGCEIRRMGTPSDVHHRSAVLELTCPELAFPTGVMLRARHQHRTGPRGVRAPDLHELPIDLVFSYAADVPRVVRVRQPVL